MFDRALTAIGGVCWPGGDAPAVRTDYERAVERFFTTGTALAFWKGRIALYALLKALGIGEGDEVIVPGYTCVMVPGPVVYAGATPVYAEIEPEYYITPAETVTERITPRTKAILVQHTYGFPAPVDEIRKIADERGIPILEDCCHTFGGRVDGKLLGTLGQAAFFSGQWNKPYSTGLGGLALIHDEALVQRTREQQASYPVPDRKAAFMLAAQLLVYEMFIYPSTTALATRLFRWLTRKGLVVGSSTNAEFAPDMPHNYALNAAPVQCRIGRLEVGRALNNLQKRSHATERYLAELPGLGYPVPRIPDNWDTPLLRFPVRVANKDEALAKASKYGVEIGSWFECPLHPIETDQAAFCYRDGTCPVSERASAEVINLPTHRRVRDRDIDKTLEFLRDVCRPADTAS